LRLASLLAVAVTGPGLAVGISPAAGSERPGYWSTPATLSACPTSGVPHVVFPSDSPEHSTGAGAVVWEASASCPGGQGVRVAAIGSRGTPGRETVPRTRAGRALAARGPLTVGGAPDGQIVIAGAGDGGRTQDLLIEGTAGGPFSALGAVDLMGAPVALATAYLGDVALASASASARGAGGLSVRLQRHYARSFGPLVRAGIVHSAPIHALTLALDYRSDALAVWTQAGAIYARELPASGAPQPIQRLAPAGAGTRLTALLSDDYRAIVAWSEQRGTQTSVYLDRSGTGVRFAAPTLLERYHDPAGLAPPAGSPSLVRLSSESVMMAWVRTAAIDRTGAPVVTTIATPGRDALLEDLATGPEGDALVLWSEPQQTATGRPNLQRNAIFAARGIDAHPGRSIFAKPEQVAPAGPNSDATVALEPDSDRALAVWRGARGKLQYALRDVGPGH
jgi:hypothetical protein